MNLQKLPEPSGYRTMKTRLCGEKSTSATLTATGWDWSEKEDLRAIGILGLREEDLEAVGILGFWEFRI